MEDLQKLMNEVSQWSDATFGSDRSPLPMLSHLEQELGELAQAIRMLMILKPEEGTEEFKTMVSQVREEFADCFMLLFDSAHHFGLTAEEVVSDTWSKLEVNKQRQWGKPDINGVVNHIREPRISINNIGIQAANAGGKLREVLLRLSEISNNTPSPSVLMVSGMEAEILHEAISRGEAETIISVNHKVNLPPREITLVVDLPEDITPWPELPDRIHGKIPPEVLWPTSQKDYENEINNMPSEKEVSQRGWRSRNKYKR